MPDRLGEVLAASLVLLLIPGPGVLYMYITVRGVDQGRWAGILSAWGVELGNLVLAVGTAAGLSAILLSSVTRPALSSRWRQAPGTVDRSHSTRGPTASGRLPGSLGVP